MGTTQKVNKFLVVLSIIVISSFFSMDKPVLRIDNTPVFQKSNISHNLPNSLLMYNNIEKYSSMYNVPKYIAYNVAYLETRYRGPFDWGYTHTQKSYAGALGPMQIMPRTANYIANDNISKKELMTNIDLNVNLSMKMLSNLYSRYKDWGVVCGYYNTGKPIINGYARYCRDNKNYRSKWLKIKKRQ